MYLDFGGRSPYPSSKRGQTHAAELLSIQWEDRSTVIILWGCLRSQARAVQEGDHGTLVLPNTARSSYAGWSQELYNCSDVHPDGADGEGLRML
ncbi:hypothetical protein FRC18_003609 [Serendipita sp. 400]|nr:hypothetical protein FRC18_003609 [Serendipita sp. 400]